ncbi:hypothetical protein LguiA_017707 [Lonicera macranthoides]
MGKSKIFKEEGKKHWRRWGNLMIHVDLMMKLKEKDIATAKVQSCKFFRWYDEDKADDESRYIDGQCRVRELEGRNLELNKECDELKKQMEDERKCKMEYKKKYVSLVLKKKLTIAYHISGNFIGGCSIAMAQWGHNKITIVSTTGSYHIPECHNEHKKPPAS